MDYNQISKETMGHLYAAYKNLQASPLTPDLKALLELRVSQINDCAYCCNLHTQEALKAGVHNSQLKNLSQWSGSSLFSDGQKSALKWAESLTTLDGNKKVQNTNLSDYFSPREIVDITLCVALMNCFNRIALSMREE